MSEQEARFKTFLKALIRVPKTEIDQLEAERPKKAKRKKPKVA